VASAASLEAAEAEGATPRSAAAGMDALANTNMDIAFSR